MEKEQHGLIGLKDRVVGNRQELIFIREIGFFGGGQRNLALSVRVRVRRGGQRGGGQQFWLCERDRRIRDGRGDLIFSLRITLLGEGNEENFDFTHCGIGLLMRVGAENEDDDGERIRSEKRQAYFYAQRQVVFYTTRSAPEGSVYFFLKAGP